MFEDCCLRDYFVINNRLKSPPHSLSSAYAFTWRAVMVAAACITDARGYELLLCYDNYVECRLLAELIIQALPGSFRFLVTGKQRTVDFCWVDSAKKLRRSFELNLSCIILKKVYLIISNAVYREFSITGGLSENGCYCILGYYYTCYCCSMQCARGILSAVC